MLDQHHNQPGADADTSVAKSAYDAPALTCFGKVGDLTAGGSARKVSEALNGCPAQQVIFRC
jgi:hypothetical protein